MKKGLKYLLYSIPAQLGILAFFSLSLGLGKNFSMLAYLVFFETFIYYIVMGFSKLYNIDVNFEKTPEYNRVTASIIIGVHVMVSVIVLGVYFAV